MDSKKLALFDMDGVIYQDHSIFDVIQDQEKSGFIKFGLWKKILDLLDKYKSEQLTYKETADGMLDVYSKYLVNKKYKDLLEYSSSFLDRNQDKIFPYFEDLSNFLTPEYDIYLISTNLDFIVEAFANRFKTKGFLSSKLNTKDGVFQEGLELSMAGNKGIVADLINKYGKEKSLAVGNSQNDIDMLEKVDFPFVMEPNDKLKEIVTQRGWQIVSRLDIADIIKAHVKK